MKQFMIFTSMVCLGCFIFNLVAGPEDSILTGLQGMWHHEAAIIEQYP